MRAAMEQQILAEFDVKVATERAARLEREVEIFVGMRHDLLRRANNPAGFQVARRVIILDQTILLARNLSFFF